MALPEIDISILDTDDEDILEESDLPDLIAQNLRELRQRARALGVKNVNNMNEDQLQERIKVFLKVRQEGLSRLEFDENKDLVPSLENLRILQIEAVKKKNTLDRDDVLQKLKGYRLLTNKLNTTTKRWTRYIDINDGFLRPGGFPIRNKPNEEFIVFKNVSLKFTFSVKRDNVILMEKLPKGSQELVAEKPQLIIENAIQRHNTTKDRYVAIPNDFSGIFNHTSISQLSRLLEVNRGALGRSFKRANHTFKNFFVFKLSNVDIAELKEDIDDLEPEDLEVPDIRPPLMAVIDRFYPEEEIDLPPLPDIDEDDFPPFDFDEDDEDREEPLDILRDIDIDIEEGRIIIDDDDDEKAEELTEEEEEEIDPDFQDELDEVFNKLANDNLDKIKEEGNVSPELLHSLESIRPRFLDRDEKKLLILLYEKIRKKILLTDSDKQFILFAMKKTEAAFIRILQEGEAKGISFNDNPKLHDAPLSIVIKAIEADRIAVARVEARRVRDVEFIAAVGEVLILKLNQLDSGELIRPILVANSLGFWIHTLMEDGQVLNLDEIKDVLDENQERIGKTFTKNSISKVMNTLDKKSYVIKFNRQFTRIP